MKENIDEYLESYIDDVTTVLAAKQKLSDGDYVGFEDRLLISSLSRIFISILVSHFENMLRLWSEKDKHFVLVKYFDDSAPNGDKVRALRDAFGNTHIETEGKYFDDYLAIKYLRNTIMHASWEDPKRPEKKRALEAEERKTYVVANGFPVDIRKFSATHFKKIACVHFKMLGYFLALELSVRLTAEEIDLVNLALNHEESLDDLDANSYRIHLHKRAFEDQFCTY